MSFSTDFINRLQGIAPTQPQATSLAFPSLDVSGLPNLSNGTAYSSDNFGSGVYSNGLDSTSVVKPYQPPEAKSPSADTLGIIGQYGSLATGLAGIYNAYKQNKLAKNRFAFQRSATNRNIANQAVTVNNQLANQVKMQAQLFGNKVGTQQYQNYVAANQQHVNGTPIQAGG